MRARAGGRAALAAGAAALLAGCKPGDAQIIALSALAMYGFGALLLQLIAVLVAIARKGSRFTLVVATLLGLLGACGAFFGTLITLGAPLSARARVVQEAFWMPAGESLLLVGGALLVNYIYKRDSLTPDDATAPIEPVPWAPWFGAWLIYAMALVVDAFALIG